jgi:hypothetical protein
LGLLNLLFFLAIVALAAVAVLPLPLKGKWQSLPPYAPLFAALAYVLYESSIAVRMNIRVDLFLVFPLLAAAFAGGVVRWGIELARDVREGKGGWQPVLGAGMELLYLAGFVYACVLVTVGDPYFATLKRALRFD